MDDIRDQLLKLLGMKDVTVELWAKERYVAGFTGQLLQIDNITFGISCLNSELYFQVKDVDMFGAGLRIILDTERMQ